MSQFAAPALNGTLSRNRAPTQGRVGTELLQGITENVVAPGVPVLPADYSSENEILQVERALGLLGQDVAGAGDLYAQQQHRIERQNAKVDALDRGLAAQHKGLDAAVFADKIAQNDPAFKVPDGQNIGTFANDFVNHYLDAAHPDAPEAYKEEYRTLAPHLAQMLGSKAEHDRAVNQNEGMDVLANAAATAPDLETAQSLVNSGGSALNLTDFQKQAVLFNAAKLSANAGKVDVVERLAPALASGPFSAQFDTLKIHAESVRLSAENQWHTRNMADLENLQAAGTPSPVLLATAEEKFKAGDINGDQLQRFKKDVALDDAHKASTAFSNLEDQIAFGHNQGVPLSAFSKELDQLNRMDPSRATPLFNRLRVDEEKRAEASFKADSINEALQSSRSGTPLSTIEEKTKTVGDKTITVSKPDQIEAVTKIEFARLAQGKTPQQAMQAQANWLAENGVEYQPWKSLVHSAYTSSGDLEKATVAPQSMVDALNLYAQIRAVQPGLAHSMFPENERLFMDTALQWQADTAVNGRPDTLGALRMANKAVNMPPEERARVSDRIKVADVEAKATEIVSAGNWFTSTDLNTVGNHDELVAALRTDAIRYARTMSAADAIKKAGENAKASGTKINNFWTYTAVPGLGADVRYDMPKVGQAVIDGYYEKNKPAGIDKADIGMVFNRNTSLWVLEDRMGRQLPGDGTSLTNTQLTEKWRAMKDAERKATNDGAAKQNKINKQFHKDVRENPPYMMPGGG